MYGANLKGKTLGHDESKEFFSFEADVVSEGARQGQDEFFDRLFDMFPTGTDHIYYDDTTDSGGYRVNGEMFQESGTLRLQEIKILLDQQVSLMEGASYDGD